MLIPRRESVKRMSGLKRLLSERPLHGLCLIFKELSVVLDIASSSRSQPLAYDNEWWRRGGWRGFSLLSNKVWQDHECLLSCKFFIIRKKRETERERELGRRIDVPSLLLYNAESSGLL